MNVEVTDDDEEIDFDSQPELPNEAGAWTSRGFEPDDEWLRSASEPLQHEAMRQWFITRYQDPQMETPYMDGEYVFIHGGPYEADDVLYDRFGDVVQDPDVRIRRVIDSVESDGIDQWAPIHDEYEADYDARFSLEVLAREEPLQRLRDRLQQARLVLTLEGDANAMLLAQKLVFASAIGAAESFLYEVAYFWIDTDERVLRNIVTKLQELRDEKIKLGDLFTKLENLEAHVKGHLQNIVWHRWDVVSRIYRAAFDVRLPSVRALNIALMKRHDIVHRSGHDKAGNPIVIAEGEIDELCKSVETFATGVDNLLRASEARGFLLGINAHEVDAPAPS